MDRVILGRSADTTLRWDSRWLSKQEESIYTWRERLTISGLFHWIPKILRFSFKSSNKIQRAVIQWDLGQTIRSFHQKFLSDIPRKPLKDGAVFLVYVLLTFVMTLPMSAQMGKQAAGQGNDMWVSHWNNWWLQKVLSEGHNLYHTPYMFYPCGVSVIGHNFSWFNSGVWLLLQTFMNRLVAHNVTILLVYIVSGCTAYLLVHELTGSREAAFIGGAIFAFYPYRSIHRNQINLLSVQWIPLFILYFIKLTRQGRLREGFIAGGALALCGLCDVRVALLGALGGALWLLYSLRFERENWSLLTVLAILVSLLTCSIVLVYFYMPLLNSLLDSTTAQVMDAAQSGKASDLLAYFLPNRYHPLHPIRMNTLKRIYRQVVHAHSDVASIGYITLGLVIWALVKRWKKARFWFFAALFFATLALGSTLHINGQELFPMPYRLLENTLLSKAVRHPSRFNLMLALPIAVLAAIGFKDLLKELSYQHRRALRLAGACAILILFEYFSPFPATEPPRSVFYEQLRKEKGRFAIADFPIGFHAHDKWYMYAQTLHEHPIIGGNVARVPEHAHDFIKSVPLLEQARIFAPGEGTLADVSRRLEPLAEAQVKYILIHKYRARPGEEEGWRKWFAIPPYYEDDYLLVYRTKPQYAQDFQFIKGEVGDGIGVISATLSTHALAQEGLLKVKAVWGTRKAPQHDWKGYFALVDDKGRIAQKASFDPCLGWPTSEWGPDAVAQGRTSLQVDPFVERGVYTVAIGLTDPETREQAGKPVAVGKVNVQAIERVFEIPAMKFESGAVFGDVLKFWGYDMQKNTDQLKLTLHWQALQRMKESYKFFVHLVEVESGQVVAQADVIPYDWTYPTIWWKDGEIVSDEITLSLQNIDLQDCQLEIGVYHANSGERLSVTSRHKLQNPPDRIILEEMNVQR